VVDRGFIGGVIVSILVSKAVDRGFIGGVMVRVLVSKSVGRGFIVRDKNANLPSMNPRSTGF
jgi:hypothetical protein